MANGDKERSEQNRTEVEELLKIAENPKFDVVTEPTKEATVTWKRPQ